MSLQHTHACPTCGVQVPCSGVLEDNPAGRDFEPVCLTPAEPCGRCRALEVTEGKHWGTAGLTREDLAAKLAERSSETKTLVAEIERLQGLVESARLEIQQLRIAATRTPAA